jgi:hypothetical protein
MVDSEEQSRIKANLAVIRGYLRHHFPLYTISETSVPSLYLKFVVTPSFLSEAATNDKLGKRYRLKVDWRRLSDSRNTPENTRSALDSGNVASGMRQKGITIIIGDFSGLRP